MNRKRLVGWRFISEHDSEQKIESILNSVKKFVRKNVSVLKGHCSSWVDGKGRKKAKNTPKHPFPCSLASQKNKFWNRKRFACVKNFSFVSFFFFVFDWKSSKKARFAKKENKNICIKLIKIAQQISLYRIAIKQWNYLAKLNFEAI